MWKPIIIILVILLSFLYAINATGSSYSLGRFQTSMQGNSNGTSASFSSKMALTAFQPVTDNATSSSYDGRVGFFEMFHPSTGATINSFTISPASMAQGENAQFTMIIQNTGNLDVDVSPTIKVYKPSGAPFDVVPVSTATILVGETQTLTKTWSSDAADETGTYTAYVNATFSGANVTNTRNVSFTISARPPREPPSDNRKIEEIKEPEKEPDEKQVKDAISVLGKNVDVNVFPVFKEVLPGEISVLSMSIENRNSQQLDLLIGAKGLATEYLKIEDEKKTAPANSVGLSYISVDVPDGASEGFYYALFSVAPVITDANGKETSIEKPLTYPLVMKVNTPESKQGEPQAVVLRTVYFDIKNQETIIELNIVNNGDKTISHLQVFEKIKAPLNQDIRKIRFDEQPSVIVEDSSTIRWDLENIKPSETKKVSYRLQGISSDYSNYFDWPIDQIAIIEGEAGERIVISDFQSEQIIPGQPAKASFRLFNSGAATETVNVLILPQQGWGSTPNSFSFVIPPRGYASPQPAFSLLTPDSTWPGSYGIGVKLSYSGIVRDKQFAVTVIDKDIYKTPQLFEDSTVKRIVDFIKRTIDTAWKNIWYLLPILAALAIAIVIILRYRKYKNAPHYDPQRVRYMEMIKKMMEKGEGNRK